METRPLARFAAAAGIVVLSLIAAACGSPPVTSSSTTALTSSPQPVTATGLRGKRYCEVLLAHFGLSGLTADVYNSYGLNDCPQPAWAALNAHQIAAENGALRAVLNGPRYWLMDSIAKDDSPQETKNFGGIAMRKEATVEIGDPKTAARPYTAHTVDRRTTFTFDSGRQIYELVDQAGARWVMQTWSQQKDPTLSEADLPGLAPRLALPAGWTYQVRVLSSPLEVITTSTNAQVLQDDLNNSYSKQSG